MVHSTPSLAEQRGLYVLDAKRESFVMIDADVGDAILGTLGPSCFAVYWHLKRRTNRDRQCWPSLDAIAEATTLSRKHVTRCLDKLEADGWITRTRRSNRYRMATSTLYTIPEKPRKFGCDMIGTSSGHDGVLNVTGTNVELDVELEPSSHEEGELTPLPPKHKKPTYSPEFEAFWTAYPSGHGVKKLAAAEWGKLDADERAAALAAIPGWRSSDKWQRGYVRDCERWLKYREWDQEPPAAPMARAPNQNGRQRGYTAAELAAMARGETEDDQGRDDGDVISVGFRVVERQRRGD